MDSVQIDRNGRPIVSVVDCSTFSDLINGRCAPPSNSKTNTRIGGVSEGETVELFKGSFKFGIEYPQTNDGSFPPIDVNEFKGLSEYPLLPFFEDNSNTVVFKAKKVVYNQTSNTSKSKKRRAVVNWAVLFQFDLSKHPTLRSELLILARLSKSQRHRRVFLINDPTMCLEQIPSNNANYLFKGTVVYQLAIPSSVAFGFVGVAPSIFQLLLPDIARRENPITPQEFYQTISNEDHGVKPPEVMKVKGLICTLLRYQRETVRWCLRKEGKEFDEEKQQVVDYDVCDSETFPPLGWFQLESGKWANPYLGRICDEQELRKLINERRQFKSSNNIGAQGLLAEEMGLGKTIEVLSLVLLNKRPMVKSPPVEVFDYFCNRNVLAAKTTLIISPRSISKQWKDEIKQHSPELSILVYNGKTESKEVTPEEMAEYDIVITSYNAISSEIYFALYDPARPTRGHVIEQRSMTNYLSPLMKIQFWRVVLDEVQMVRSSVSNAAQVAKLIPRVHAWGVTGTPVTKELQDLQGILNFLRLEPWATGENAWYQLVRSPGDFMTLFSDIAIRHTTAMVEDDIALPPQSRNLCPLPFTTIEADNYNQLYKSFLIDCNLNENGERLNEDQPVDMSSVASWLVRLRQTCCHAKFGGGISKRNVNPSGSKEVKTIDEIHSAMVDQAFTELLTEQRKKDMSMLNRGRVLLENLKEKAKALSVFEQATKSVENTVRILQKNLEVAQEEQKKAEEERAKREESRMNLDDDDDYRKEELELEEEENEEDFADVVNMVAKRLRNWLEVLHRCYFFVATTHYQMYKKEDEDVKKEEDGAEDNKDKIKKEDMSEEDIQHQKLESEYYGKAQSIRRQILQESMQKVNESTEKLKAYSFVPLKQWEGEETKLEQVGFEKQQINLLIEQTTVVGEWRDKLIDYLSKDVVDESADPDGQEYEDSLNSQEYAFDYLEVFQKVLSDRSLIITGRSDPLLKGNVDKAESKRGGEKDRQKNSPKRKDKEKNSDEVDMLKLLNKRLTTMKPKDYGYGVSWMALSNRMAQLKRAKKDATSTKKEPMKREDAIKAVEAHDNFVPVYDDLKNELLQLTKEVRVLRGCYNRRVGYYKQLQQMSDNVGEVDVSIDRSIPYLNEQLVKEGELDIVINQKLGRKRYLESLSENTSHTNSNVTERICIICQSEYKLGSWTVCGHEFCRKCLNKWLRTHGTCPICKHRINPGEVYSLTHLTEAEKKQNEPSMSEFQVKLQDDIKHQGSIYKPVEKSLINTIRSSVYSSLENFGTKIDHMMRHLKWLRLTEPGAQVVVFSQWAEMLKLFGAALTHNKFKYATVEHGMDLFKTDSSYACFLLHAKSQS